MALTVEDGTGLPNSDAFVSVDDADAYFGTVGGDWAGDPADKEAAIRRATAWLSLYFRWRGRRVKGREQALAWPRAGVSDREGAPVPSDEVPIEVKRATYAAALYELNNPFDLTPEVVPGEQLERVRVGPLAVGFRKPNPGAADGVDDSRVVLTEIHDLLRGLVEGRAKVPHPVVV